MESIELNPFKRQSHKMAKHNQTIRRQICRRIVWVYLAILFIWHLKG